jgi:endonuclease I
LSLVWKGQLPHSSTNIVFFVLKHSFFSSLINQPIRQSDIAGAINFADLRNRKDVAIYCATKIAADERNILSPISNSGKNFFKIEFIPHIAIGTDKSTNGK